MGDKADSSIGSIGHNGSSSREKAYETAKWQYAKRVEEAKLREMEMEMERESEKREKKEKRERGRDMPEEGITALVAKNFTAIRSRAYSRGAMSLFQIGSYSMGFTWVLDCIGLDWIGSGWIMSGWIC